MIAHELITSHAARVRIERARAWLSAHAPAAEVVIVGANAAAAAELVRTSLGSGRAAFGWHHLSFAQLAASLASPALVHAGLVPVSRLAATAVVTNAVQIAGRAGKLGRYALVADTPGFARAIARGLEDLRLARVEAAALAQHDPDLAELLGAYESCMAEARLTDWPGVLAAARSSVAGGDANALLDLPLLLLDLQPQSKSEALLIAALVARAPELLVTLPATDAQSRVWMERIEGLVHTPLAEPSGSALVRLQQHLFSAGIAPEGPLGEEVQLFSAPGESRECVEIVRAVLQRARAGMAFDRMGVLLRAPEAYRAHLEEACSRAGIPTHFARGARRPDPAGRAFLALLGCAAERLSARRFAEYLSLGEVPDATPEGTPPPSLPPSERTVASEEELAPRAIGDYLEGVRAGADPSDGVGAGADPNATVTAGQLRAPRRWEQLLVDAAVIGGRERWRRRLDGLRATLELDLAEAGDEDDNRAEALRRALDDLESFRVYALPLIDTLADLPASAAWGTWIDCLGALATRSLREPTRVLAVLGELAPMADVGPVTISDVLRVLTPRLREIAVSPPARRHGRLLIAPIDAVRGLELDVVFIPGLAERLFPPRIAEDPILLDETRIALGHGLVTNAERIARERLALALAAGAACQSVVLSYPRVNTEQSRARVPSFYALEALRAAEGVLPDFAALAARAESASRARIGWPAPDDPSQAIDEAEHDLALLDRLMQRDANEAIGTARYLLSANPHLARALRFRARRWIRRWTSADGLVNVSPAALEAIKAHWLDARSYSPTALQNYSTCPYKFLLYAVYKLTPREVPMAIDELNPLERGSLVHDVLFRLFRKLERVGLLPVRNDTLERARKLLNEIVDEVAAEYHDKLAPAIERVWEDGIAMIRADLREWLRRAAEDDSGYIPWRFELAFGLPGSRMRDPQSVTGAVDLNCGIQLRGSIDLVERRADGSLRATDHKTGKNISKHGQIIAGGESLQPVLYALAAEKLFTHDGEVAAGRLYYCTANGGYAEHEVPLDPTARRAADVLAEVVGDALGKPFLPAAPGPDRCRWCDYRVVCGPNEEARVARKPQDRLEPLQRLRTLP